jgi:hypothetical protein
MRCALLTKRCLLFSLAQQDYVNSSRKILWEIIMNKSIAVVLMLLSTATQADETSSVPYPEGYRDWRHIKSMVINEGHPLHGSFGGIHHLYANTGAQDGYRSGRFPDGAVIVFDLYEALAADNAITEGKHKIVGVMHKDARRYASTGGWGYEGFAGGDPAQRAVGANAAKACHECHTAQQAHDYVFSNARD